MNAHALGLLHPPPRFLKDDAVPQGELGRPLDADVALLGAGRRQEPIPVGGPRVHGWDTERHDHYCGGDCEGTKGIRSGSGSGGTGRCWGEHGTSGRGSCGGLPPSQIQYFVAASCGGCHLCSAPQH
ncbi:hypothetical protein ACLOJK_029682 [Asimina triloba]